MYFKYFYRVKKYCCANSRNQKSRCSQIIIFLYSGRWTTKKTNKNNKKNGLRLGACIVLNQELKYSGHWEKTGLRAQASALIL